MLLHTENCKDAKKLIETINKVNYKLQDTRLIYRNLLHFYTLIVAIREFKNTIQLLVELKKIKSI